MSVIWHDLECGTYTADLPFWTELAGSCEGPILDVGAGTGRVAIALARAGHRVTALDSDAELLAELETRARGLGVDTVCADARSFSLPRRYALCIVPMQTIQLLGGPGGRQGLLVSVRQHLAPGGRLAIAIAEQFELFEVGPGMLGPLPDVCERDGIVYSSLPIAVRADGDGYVLERERETVALDGNLTRQGDRIRLDALSAETLEAEGAVAGFTPERRRLIAATEEHVASRVVMLRA